MTSQSANINRWGAFALLAVAFFMTVIDLTIVNVSLPTIGRDLHFSETNLQWVVAAYVVIERRVTDPILPLSIFRLRTLAGANTAGLLLGASFYAFIFVGTLYMQQVLHYSALQSGLAWLAASLTSIALAGLSQALVTRGGTKIVMAAGMTMIGVGAIWATQVPVPGHFLAHLAGPMVVAGAGTAFAFIPISIAALAGVKEQQAGLASGLLNTNQRLEKTMRKIVNSAFVSLDGVTEDPRSWATFDPDSGEEAAQTLEALDG